MTWYDDINDYIRKQYQDYVSKVYNMTVDGTKALRINFADYLSYQFAYKAMKSEIENLTEKPQRMPGLLYSIEQFFWIAAMQRYCHVNKDQETLQKLVLSKFPIESYRANNPLKNNADFNLDFGCSNELETNIIVSRDLDKKGSANLIGLSTVALAISLIISLF